MNSISRIAGLAPILLAQACGANYRCLHTPPAPRTETFAVTADELAPGIDADGIVSDAACERACKARDYNTLTSCTAAPPEDTGSDVYTVTCEGVVPTVCE